MKAVLSREQQRALDYAWDVAWPDLFEAFNVVALDCIAKMRDELRSSVTLMGVPLDDMASAHATADAIFTRLARHMDEAMTWARRAAGPPAGPWNQEAGCRESTHQQMATFARTMDERCPPKWWEHQAIEEERATRLRVAGYAHTGCRELDDLAYDIRSGLFRGKIPQVEYTADHMPRLLRSVQDLVIKAKQWEAGRKNPLHQLPEEEQKKVRERLKLRFAPHLAAMLVVDNARPKRPGYDRPKGVVHSPELWEALLAYERVRIASGSDSDAPAISIPDIPGIPEPESP